MMGRSQNNYWCRRLRERLVRMHRERCYIGNTRVKFYVFFTFSVRTKGGPNRRSLQLRVQLLLLLRFSQSMRNYTRIATWENDCERDEVRTLTDFSNVEFTTYARREFEQNENGREPFACIRPPRNDCGCDTVRINWYTGILHFANIW